MQQNFDKIIEAPFGSGICVKWSEPVSGGDINEAYHLVLTNGTEVFLKQNTGVPEDFFPAEAHGLQYMRLAGANVPSVLAVGSLADGTGYLLMEYARNSRQRTDYSELLGHMLANMHLADVSRFTKEKEFGLEENNYIGATRQINTVTGSWIEFFRDRRLGVQMQLAEPHFDREDRRMCSKLLDHLGEYLVEPNFSSLLHGDLWGGNVMPDNQGSPMLIDPAVYVGHHEADLAMTELFGGFAPTFYAAYHEIIPREPGYADRRELYNLYHLLNHLNIFGGSYLASVRRILKRYVRPRV